MFRVVLEAFPKREMEKLYRTYKKYNHRVADREVRRRLRGVLAGRALVLAELPTEESAENLRKEAAVHGAKVRVEPVDERAAA